MSEKPTPPWANDIPEGSFISYAPTYKVGEYFDRFHKGCDTDISRLNYYFYDPTEHGYKKGQSLPSPRCYARHADGTESSKRRSRLAI